MRLTIFALVLLFWPVAEITLFAVTAGKIGIFYSVGLLLLAMLVGGAILRFAGTAGLLRMQTSVARGESPGKELVGSALIFVSAMLFIVPGLISDAVGLLLLLPFVRNAVWKWVAANAVVLPMTGGFGTGRRSEPDVIDLDSDEFSVRDDGKKADRRPDRALNQDI